MPLVARTVNDAMNALDLATLPGFHDELDDLAACPPRRDFARCILGSLGVF